MKQIKRHSILKRFGFHVKFLLVAAITGFTADAVQFDCYFEYDTLDFVGSVYSCWVTVTSLGSTTLENVTGIHQWYPSNTNDDVEFLNIRNQNLPFVPQGIVIFFKNLRAIQISDTRMISISAQDLQPFPELEYLFLSGHNLTSLDGDLFSCTPLLKFIFLALNQIQHIGHDLVTNLDNLENLDLQANICINKVARNRTDVVELAPQLSLLCPPLDEVTTVATTTELPIEQCPCDDEIGELRKEIDQIQKANEILLDLNTALEKRLLEIEMKLLEIL